MSTAHLSTRSTIRTRSAAAALCTLFFAAACDSAEGGAPNLQPASELRYDIEWASFLGGAEGEEAREIIVEPDGNLLVGIHTKSDGLVTSPNAFQKHYAGDDPASGHPGVHGGDLYFARISPDGSRILADTYYGGSKQERSAYGMELDADGNIAIACMTRSPDLPTTPGAFQRKYGGGESDWAVAKLSADLTTLLWSTYLGGKDQDSPRGGLGLGPDGGVYIVGQTSSPDFPARPGPTLTSADARSAALVVLGPDGSYRSGTLVGGSEDEVIVGVRVAPDRSVWLGGYTHSTDFPVTPDAAQPKSGGKADLFFMRLSPSNELLYSTYFGGAGGELSEHRIALDPDGTVLHAAFSNSSNFPATPGAFQKRRGGPGDGMLASLTPDGKFGFATLLGGSQLDVVLDPQRHESGRILLPGNTESRDFPVTRGALQERYAGGKEDGVVVLLSEDGSQLLYSTFLGGTGKELVRSAAFGPDGAIYLVGRTSSRNFPVTAGAFQPEFGGGDDDAFVVKLVPRSITTDSSVD